MDDRFLLIAYLIGFLSYPIVDYISDKLSVFISNIFN